MKQKSRHSLQLWCIFISLLGSVAAEPVYPENEAVLERSKRSAGSPVLKTFNKQFSIKHTTYSSFEEVMSNPELLKQNILFDHIAVEKGSPLFQYRNREKTFEQWLEKSVPGQHPFVVVQSKIHAKDVDSMEADILSQSATAQQKLGIGPGSDHALPGRKEPKPALITNDVYNTYDILYEMVPKRQPNMPGPVDNPGIDVYLVEHKNVKLQVDVKLTTTGTAEVHHFDKTVEIPNVSSRSNPQYVLTIQKDDFELMKKLRDKAYVYKDPGILSDLTKLAKETDPINFFKKLTRICEERETKGRKKRSIAKSSACSLVADNLAARPEKKKVTVPAFNAQDTRSLLKQYANGDDVTKTEITKNLMTRPQPGKISNRNPKQVKMQESFINADKVRSHIKVAETATKLQKPGVSPLTIDSLTTPSKQVSVSDNQFKLSPSSMKRKLEVMSERKSVKTFTTGVQKLVKPIGYGYLAKDIINGVNNGDNIALATIASKFVADRSLERASARYQAFKAGLDGKLSKPGQFLGKFAGPIGTGIDVGLSAWQIKTGVDSLRKATDRFEKRDATLSIIEGSASATIAAISVGAMIAAPPLAPLIGGTAFLADLSVSVGIDIARSVNEVARISALKNETQFREQTSDMSENAIAKRFPADRQQWTHAHYKSYERLRGRMNVSDNVVISPTIKYIDLGGGSAHDPDVIEIPDNKRQRAYMTGIVAQGHTVINSHASSGQITLLLENQGYNNIMCYVDVPDAVPSGLRQRRAVPTSELIFYAKMPFYHEQADISWHEQRMIITHKFNGGTYSFQVERNKTKLPAAIPELLIAFEEEKSVLQINLPLQDSVLHHNLTKNINATRVGTPSLRNVFQVWKGQWSVFGGDEDDEFILYSNIRSSFIDGNGGSQNALRFGETFSHIDLNLPLGQGLDGRLQFHNISRLNLPQESSASVVSSCSFQVIHAPGGTSLLPQLISIDEESFNAAENCSADRQLIVLEGATHVTIRNSEFKDLQASVLIRGVDKRPGQNWQGSPLDISVDADIANGTGASLMIYSLDWAQVLSTSSQEADKSIRLVNPTEGTVELAFRLPQNRGTNASQVGVPVFYNDFIMGTLIPQAHNEPGNLFHYVDSGVHTDSTRYFGWQGLRNTFLIQNGTNYHITAGAEEDTFLIQTDLVQGLQIQGNGAKTTLVINEPVGGADLVANIDLSQGKFFFHPDHEARIAGVLNVFGMEAKKDIIHVDLNTLTVAGRGGTPPCEKDQSSALFDEIFITDPMTNGNSSFNVEIDVAIYTRVNNNASSGNFTYKVHDVDNCDVYFTPTNESTHSFQFNHNPNNIESIEWIRDNRTLKLTLKSLKELHFSGADINTHVSFFVPEKLNCALDVLADDSIQATFQIHSFLSKVYGLPVATNRFFVASPSSDVNQSHHAEENTWGYLRGHKAAANSLILANDLCADGVLIADLHSKTGHLDCLISCAGLINVYVGLLVERLQAPNDVTSYSIPMSDATKKLMSLEHINSVVARSEGTDIVIPDCKTTSVLNAEAIIVFAHPDCDYTYDMTMTIGAKTTVTFAGALVNDDLYPVYGSFKYRFLVPRSFDFQSPMEVIGDHMYVFPFTVDEIAGISFSTEFDTLTYHVRSEGGPTTRCEHKLVLFPEDEFYSQPGLITADNYQIKVSRTGAIMLIAGEDLANKSKSSLGTATSNIISIVEALAMRLTVTVIARFDTDKIIFAGHQSTPTDRNVLQNSQNLISYLLGGGSAETLYQITDLQNDVFILPGFHAVDKKRLAKKPTLSIKHHPSGLEQVKQIIDLTSVTIPIREESQTKFLPTVRQNGSDLVIHMGKYQYLYPGKLVLVNGTTYVDRIQVQVSASMMDISYKEVKGPNETINYLLTRRRQRESSNAGDDLGWMLSPQPVVVPRGYVYALSQEDLETGQQILTEDLVRSVYSNSDDGETKVNGSSYDLGEKGPAVFQVVRNGTDLLLTNLQNAVTIAFSNNSLEEPNITTIIITEFFNTKLSPCTWDSNLNCTGEAYDQALVEDNYEALFSVLEVQVMVPGLEVILNGSSVVKAKQFLSEEITDDAAVEVQVLEPLNWSGLVDATNEVIYEILPELRAGLDWEYVVTMGLVGVITTISTFALLVTLAYCSWRNGLCSRTSNVMDALESVNDNSNQPNVTEEILMSEEPVEERAHHSDDEVEQRMLRT